MNTRGLTFVVSAAALLASTAAPLQALPWTDLAAAANLTSNDNGISGTVFDLQDREIDGGRFHQSIDWDNTNGKVAFVRPTADDVSFVRFFNNTDPVGGAFAYKLQYLTGANPALDASWTDIPGSARSFASNPRSYFQSFDPVNTKGIRWVLTQDNNPTGTGNIRYSEFEYYTHDQNQIDQIARAAEIKHFVGASSTDITSLVSDNDMSTRFVGPTNGAQKVRMLWNQPFVAEFMRILAGDTGPVNGIESFSVEYLKIGGDPDTEADWLPTGVSFTGNSSPLLEFNLPSVLTRGLRLNMSDPSSFAADERLRLNEIEVFPEPGGLAMLAFVGAACLSRRRK